MDNIIPVVLAFPLEQAVSELEKHNLLYSVSKTFPPGGCCSVKGKMRVVRQNFQKGILHITVAEENWKPLSCRERRFINNSPS